MDGSLFRRIDHIGVIVADIGEQRRWLGEVFGLPVTREVNVAEWNLREVFFGVSGVDIEVIQLDDPEARRKQLGEGGHRARIEHIAVEVSDIKAVLAKLIPLGVKTRDPEIIVSDDRMMVWTVAETTGGVSYQFIQRVKPRN